MRIFLCRVLYFISLSFLVSGCFQIIEEVDLDGNGSGTYKLTINLSQSRVKLAGIMELDSISGIKIPQKEVVRDKIEAIAAQLRTQPGVSKVHTRIDFDQYIFELSFNFSDVNKLDQGISETIRGLVKKEDQKSFVEYQFRYGNGKFERNFSYFPKQDINKLAKNHGQVLEQADFIAIYRFPQSIKSYSNTDTKVSSSRRASMLRYTFDKLALNPQTIKNTIYFK